ncbi:hypothetical protein J2X48_004544 [Bosea sp. BE271]|uniref:hypothetical protein n=1 Tax=Bosea TaxID=85413 RepID=UPI002856CFBD|nr:MULTISPECIES: hypothetical protein [Bosea]MDR6830912.1 hypothetical protein [Bosea robiniae]MDR6830915.1 hypothetical protein [Bosea robiniae]MDR6897696.1 hypothetical protein [Bosea sp. BE109]MDR6897699.1 hypothetical protein [Bosea sp. BE109]MDR7141093.1 hypothetical protein [Bosea sp. BE168]
MRDPRSPLVDHADDHVLDQGNIVAATLNNTLSEIVPPGRNSKRSKTVLKTGPKANSETVLKTEILQ